MKCIYLRRKIKLITREKIMNKNTKFEEYKIRPSRAIEESEKLHQKDIIKLFRHKKKFVNVPCPACESNNFTISFYKNGFSFCNCKVCDTLYINPRPSFELLMDFYSNSLYIKCWSEKIFPLSEKYRRKLIANLFVNRVIDLCQKYRCDNKILADVGAGSGTFCSELEKKDKFKEIIAIEPSHGLAQLCRNKKLNVIEAPIEKVKLENISVLTIFETIEHTFDASLFIKNCHRIISKNGVLIISTPNIKGFDLITLGDRSDNIDGPEHMNYFNIQSLSILLKRCGFVPLEFLTPGKLDAEIVRNKILKGHFDVSREPFLKYILIDKWTKYKYTFQEFLAANCLSSHLWMVARKR